MRALAALLVFLCTTAVQAAGQTPTTNGAAMREAAQRVLASVPEATRANLSRPFDDADRFDWHYTPRSRNGAALKELDARGREAVHALLRTALSAEGYRKATNIIELELVLKEIEAFGLMRDPERYHLTIYGAPDARAAWAWRFEGHHLSLHFTLAGDRATASTPSFFGANPARVPANPKFGARQGLRVLAAEEDEARLLLEMLRPAQRREAVFEARTFGEIVTANAAKADPLKPAGLAAGKMDERQRGQLLKLIEAYANSFEPSLAAARLARVREGGIEAIHFGWAGPTERGRPHYYRVQGPGFLIEYDCSQNDGNHIHTVWRDFNGDFGRDLLRQHYAAARGTRHRH